MNRFEPNVEDVKRLKEETGRSMLDCKMALEHAKGDFAKAKASLVPQSK